ncbi:MAG: DNA adenine methylase [Candidatus Tectomicrobia bacterium]|nr:DNA adenine methylase [Candidatus Tectomicrobia bacterium]
MSAAVSELRQRKESGAARPVSPAPFLKWAGGKTQLLSQFEPFFPQGIERYIEPFVGGGAVFFHVAERFRPERVVLSDSNEELINAYVAVRDNVEGVIEALREHRWMHSPDYYYKMRAVKPRTRTGRAARFIYLNKTCYNGLYRVNAKGEFNVPVGSYKNPKIFDAENLRLASEALQEVDIQVRRFTDFVPSAKGGDFFYFDPPYHPISRTSSFTSYTPEAFGEEDQGRLAEVYRALDGKGCRLMLSNSDCGFVRGLYRGFRIEEVRARRAINSNGRGRGEVSELLVLNY